MADNTTLPATGDVIATDDVGGVKFQRVKLTLGSDGVSDGDVSASNPVPASDASAQATLLAVLALNDSMLYMLGAILEKMPRVTGTDQAAVSIENGTVTTVANVANISAISGRTLASVPDALSQVGALHLYRSIIVSTP